MKLLIGFIAVLVCSASALVFDRPCRDDVTVKENFSPAFYTGTWFELYNSFDQGEDCVTHHYTRRGLQQVFDVERIGVFENEFFTNTGVVSVAFPDETPMVAIFNATIRRGEEEFEYNYRVVATDYTNYAVVWSCINIENDQSIEEGEVLSRSTSLNDASWVKVDAILAANDLFRVDFRPIPHTPEECLLGTPED